jgi:hypothetical protein
LKINLTNFRVAAVPQTEGLAEQKKLSLKTEEQWWLDVLFRGYVWKSKQGLDETFGVWHERETTDLLYDSFRDYAKRERHPLSREHFGAFMQRMGAKKRQFEKGGILGESRGDTGAKVVRTDKRVYGYILGTLDQARAGFAKATGLEPAWDDAELELNPPRLWE